VSRPTIALFADGGFLAHTTRAFEVGRALHRAFDYRVVFFCEGPYSHIPRDAGFDVRPIYTVDREITMQLAKRAGACDLTWWREVCDLSVRSDIAALESLGPDLVVGDMHWSLSTSARVLQIPYVAIANGAWTRYYAPTIEPLAGHFVTRFGGEHLFKVAFPPFKRFMTWYYSLGYTEIRKRHGLPPVRSMYDLIAGDITLLADIPEYMPLTDDAPASYRHVGPILWDADLPVPPWVARLDPERPTVYFTMGSTGDTQFFHEAIRVFGNTEYQVLITTGGLADIGHAPENVFIEKYAPGKALMQASDAVVSHGGNGTIYQALSCGVPVIGFPSIFEQEMNLQRVCALGAGLRMWRSQYDARALKRAVDEVLGHPGYRERCTRIAAAISRMDGKRRAAIHIDQFIRTRDPLWRPEDPTDQLRYLPAVE
jgi:MGT family glycosyltransferase